MLDEGSVLLDFSLPSFQTCWNAFCRARPDQLSEQQSRQSPDSLLHIPTASRIMPYQALTPRFSLATRIWTTARADPYILNRKEIQVVTAPLLVGNEGR